jgi:hypothetical protein
MKTLLLPPSAPPTAWPPRILRPAIAAVTLAATGFLNVSAGYPNNIADPEDDFALQFGLPNATGVTTWQVSEPWINLWIVNQPLTYNSTFDLPQGFAVAFRQRDTRNQPYIAGVGHGYAHGWLLSRLSFVSYTPNWNFPCTVYPGLGGVRTYTADGLKEIATASTMNRLWDQSGFQGWQINRPSGAVEKYQYLVGGSGNWLAFLSTEIDPEGRETTFSYDSDSDGITYYTRLRTIRDPDHKNLAINYYPNDGTNFSWQIREVLDPYGRRATFILRGVMISDLNRVGSSL